MRMRIFLVLIATAFTVLLSGDGGALTKRARPDVALAFQRIKFHIVAVEEKGAERIIISESTVEGPPNTDFNINLEGERFRMRARFLTDLIRPDALRVRAKLDTRRLYGYSERNLPLYEEDQQSQSLELGFDEAVVLLPFGRAGGEHRLKIEITPTLSGQTATLPAGKARPLEIDILRPSPGGILSFEASKNPHNFVVEAVVLEDGREVAGGTVPLLIEERGEITLQPNSKAGPETAANPIIINLVVERYAMSRPADQVTFAFDIYGTNPAQGTRRTSLAHNWSGVASLDSNLTYDLNGQYLSTTGKKYEISFKFKLAPGEQAD
jgi:hypothetical protein